MHGKLIQVCTGFTKTHKAMHNVHWMDSEKSWPYEKPKCTTLPCLALTAFETRANGPTNTSNKCRGSAKFSRMCAWLPSHVRSKRICASVSGWSHTLQRVCAWVRSSYNRCPNIRVKSQLEKKTKQTQQAGPRLQRHRLPSPLPDRRDVQALGVLLVVVVLVVVVLVVVFAVQGSAHLSLPPRWFWRWRGCTRRRAAEEGADRVRLVRDVISRTRLSKP